MVILMCEADYFFHITMTNGDQNLTIFLKNLIFKHNPNPPTKQHKQSPTSARKNPKNCCCCCFCYILRSINKKGKNISLLFIDHKMYVIKVRHTTNFSLGVVSVMRSWLIINDKQARCWDEATTQTHKNFSKQNLHYIRCGWPNPSI